MSKEAQPKIVITEAFSPRHIGNWALAVCAVEQLRSAFPNGQITILARDPEGITEITGERSIAKLFPYMPHHASFLTQILWAIPNTLWALVAGIILLISRGDLHRFSGPARAFTRGARRNAFEAILEADLIVSISGESINEDFLKKLPFVLFTYWLPARLGKPVVLFPQSFGPLHSGFFRRISLAVFNRCALLMPREHESMRFLIELGLPPERCPLVPDVATALRPIGEQATEALLKKLGLDRKEGPLMAITPSVFQDSGDTHIRHLAGATRRFLDKHSGARTIVLIGNRSGGICGCNDRSVAEKFMEFLDSDGRVRPLLDCDLSPAEFKGLCSSIDLFITCRMHMAILATMTCTPTIALATQGKILDYMRICDQEKYVVSIKDGLSEEGLLSAMEEALASAQQIICQLAESRDRLQPLAKTAGARAKEALMSCRQPNRETIVSG
jgi:polysaccharide pyruvyl transferase WcaK-like protein